MRRRHGRCRRFSRARADDRILSDVKNVIFHTRSNIFPPSVIEGVVVMTAFAGLYPCSEGPYTDSPTLALTLTVAVGSRHPISTTYYLHGRK